MHRSAAPISEPAESLTGGTGETHRWAAAGILSFWTLFWAGRGLENFLGRPGEIVVTQGFADRRTGFLENLTRLDASPQLAEMIVQLFGFVEVLIALGFAGGACVYLMTLATASFRRMQRFACQLSVLVLLALLVLEVFHREGTGGVYHALALVSSVLTFKVIAARADPTL